MIGIINYRAGNLHNLMNAVEAIGVSAKIYDSPEGLEEADKLILPGVGSFGFCMENLRAYGFVESLQTFFDQNKPILGICVGMQLLLKGSEENPEIAGLGWVDGIVKKFQTDDLKVPQIGWNQIQFKADPILQGLKQQTWFYFIHSYYCDPTEKTDWLGSTIYGQPFCSIVKQKNLYGFQFHPEKSHDNGLKLLQNFCNL